MSSLAHCLHEEADTIMFAHSTDAAKRANKKISSRTVGTDVIRGAFVKFLAWSFISVTDLQTLSCLVPF